MAAGTFPPKLFAYLRCNSTVTPLVFKLRSRIFVHFEGRDGLIADDQLGMQGQRPGNTDLLPLSAAELVGKAVHLTRTHASTLLNVLESAIHSFPDNRTGKNFRRSQPLMKAGYLLPLDDYIKNWDLWQYVYEPFKKRMQYEGKVYQIPIQSCSIPLYYRKDIFEKAGLDTNFQPTSWDEIIEAAVVIKRQVPDVTPLLFIGGKEARNQVTFSRFNLIFHGAGGSMMDDKAEKWIVTS